MNNVINTPINGGNTMTVEDYCFRVFISNEDTLQFENIAEKNHVRIEFGGIPKHYETLDGFERHRVGKLSTSWTIVYIFGKWTGICNLSDEWSKYLRDTSDEELLTAERVRTVITPERLRG